mgnify:CR=1 FL=1
MGLKISLSCYHSYYCEVPNTSTTTVVVARVISLATQVKEIMCGNEEPIEKSMSSQTRLVYCAKSNGSTVNGYQKLQQCRRRLSNGTPA